MKDLINGQFTRTALLLGEDAMRKLNRSRVAVFGIGGVGGYAVEALARSGVGAFELIDRDVVSESNLNRQIIATHKTIGRGKTEVMAERIHDHCQNRDHPEGAESRRSRDQQHGRWQQAGPVEV